jgi:hypothetical protein
MCLFPEPSGDLERVDAGLTPPRALVAGAMHRTMMPATEWDRELIADLAAECTRLREPEVVGVAGLAAAQETRLLGDVAQVLPVTIAPRRSHREDTLVDALCFIRVGLELVELVRAVRRALPQRRKPYKLLSRRDSHRRRVSSKA